MGLLTDTDLNNLIHGNIEEKISDEELTIYPYDKDLLTPIGYDLRIGNEYSISNKVGKIKLTNNEEFVVKSGETVLIRILERILMPKNNNISGLVVSKVSITAKGLINSTTTIDPDWNGNLLLVIHNHSKAHVKLKQGQAICTVMFFENKSPSTKPSEKFDKRNDLLVELWNELNSNAKRKQIFIKLLSPMIIMVSFLLGLWIFGNAPGLIAIVALGVALSQFITFK
jgi:deoxycytidine triphosphate deaminase